MHLPEFNKLRVYTIFLIVLAFFGLGTFSVNASEADWVEVKDLKPGDLVYTKSGWTAIESIERVDQPGTFYNLTVGEPNTFWAGDILAHNKDCSGISYTIEKSCPAANSTMWVDISRVGASNCIGNWDNVRLWVDGNPVWTPLCYHDGSNCAEGYHANINVGAPGTHTLQFTVNNGTCLCNEITFNTGPALPSGLSASCPSPGTSATLSWNASTGAENYLLRVNDTIDGWTGCPSGGGSPNDYCKTTSALSDVFSSIVGHSYTWWMHARDTDTGCISAAVSGPAFSCSACPSCPASISAVFGTCGLDPDEYENDITWANVSDEDGFNIYRCSGVGCDPASTGILVNSSPLPANTTSYTDNNGGACFEPNAGTYRYLVLPVASGCATPAGCPVAGVTIPSTTCRITSIVPDPVNVKIGEEMTGFPRAQIEISNGNCNDHLADAVFTSNDAGIASVSSTNIDFGLCLAETSTTGEGLGSTTIGFLATLTNGATCECGTVGNADCPVVQVAAQPSWFQAENGDIHAGLNISDPVVEGNYCLTLPQYLPVSTVEFSCGVAFHDEGEIPDFGAADRISEDGNDWVVDRSWPRDEAGSVFAGLYYTYFEDLIAPMVDPANEINEADYSSIDPGFAEGYYRIVDDPADPDTDVHFQLTSDSNIPTNRKLVFLVDGDLTIGADITLAESSSLVFFVSGDVTIQPSTEPRAVDGVYVVNGIFSTQSQFDPLVGTPDGLFTGRGIFIAGAFSLERNLLEGNSTGPAEKFIFDPGQWLELPQEIWHTNFIWQEIAP